MFISGEIAEYVLIVSSCGAVNLLLFDFKPSEIVIEDVNIVHRVSDRNERLFVCLTIESL